MLKKLLTLSLMLIFASSIAIAQQFQVLDANGDIQKLKKGDNIREVLSKSKVKGKANLIAKHDALAGIFDPTAVADTLKYYPNDDDITSNFGFFGQDVMVQWFQAPADIKIKAVGFSTSDDEGASAGISFRLIKANWTWEQLTTLPDIPAGLHIGLYPSEGDGYAGYDFFGESATGAWIDSSDGRVGLPPWTDNADPDLNTFDFDLWSDEGLGWPVTPVQSDAGARVYQWVIMDDLLNEPELMQGDVFGVVAVHDGLLLDDERVGFWSGSPNVSGIPGWKYYENGRFNPGVGNGWFARNFSWDYVVAVELTSDRAPKINSVSRQLTTVETGPITITANIFDDNPSGEAAGVATADLMYSLDTGNTYSTVAMSLVSGDALLGDWAGDIPGQSPGTLVTYKVMATDVGGFSAESVSQSYSIFEVVNSELLIIYNGSSASFDGGFLLPYYLRGSSLDTYDFWNGFGPVSGFVSDYDAVLEIHADGGGTDDNRAHLRAVAEAGKPLAVIGQEVLGYLVAFADSNFQAGDYEFDVLGVATSFNDVNFVGGTPDVIEQDSASVIIPQAGTVYGDAFAQFLTDNGLANGTYDPAGILGNSENWMDQFTPRDDIGSEVFMHGIALDGSERPIGHNFVHTGGAPLMFVSADPLSFTSDSGWVGSSSLSPLTQFIDANFVSVKLTNENIPAKFSLSQNYPNPFNPSTKIEFSVREQGLTSLKIYNILGQEVATLINKQLSAGTYSVDFDAKHLSSGMYIYSLKSGDQEFSKKMLLLK